MIPKPTNRLIDEAKEIGLYQQDQEILSFLDFLTYFDIANVLDIGTQDGGTFYLWCNMSHEDGVKITLDLPNGPYSTRSQSDEDIEKRDTMIRSWGKNVHVFNADSHQDETVKLVEKTLDGQDLDFLFIDGDHTLDGATRDFSNYQKFVRKGGLIAFHDIAMSDWHASVGCFVSVLWQRLKGMYPVTYEFGPFENWGGIGVVQVGITEYPEKIVEFVENHNKSL